MTALRTAHAIGMVLTFVAIGMLLHGWLRLPVALLCVATLIQFASLEHLRVLGSTTARKVKP
jgi:hypothetical protein